MQKQEKARYVHHVFETISENYDRGNIRISLGLQKKWKQALIRKLCGQIKTGGDVLDVCCGTGDIALALTGAGRGLCVTGIDFSAGMLRQARRKDQGTVRWVRGDALQLPFADNSFDAATISFGLRNTADYGRAVREMYRVLRPGGRIYCLDSFVPQAAPVRPFYRLYFQWLMPLIGGGRRYWREYGWLWKSTKEFLSVRQLARLFRECGFAGVSKKHFLFGACTLLVGEKLQLQEESIDE